MRLIKHQIIEIAFVDRHLIRKSCLLNVYGSDYLLFGSAMIQMFVLLGPIAWYKYIYIISQKFKLLKKIIVLLRQFCFVRPKILKTTLIMQLKGL